MPTVSSTVASSPAQVDGGPATGSSHSDERLGQADRRLRETAQAITKLICEDMAHYPERELRRRFVDCDAADLLSEAELAELRRLAEQLGKQMAEKIDAAFAWPGPWPLCVAPAATGPADARPSLRDLPLIWAPIASVDALVEQVATQFRLPADDRQPGGYSPPARFIGRAHLPALTDQLVKHLREATALRGQATAEAVELRRRLRADRWANPQD